MAQVSITATLNAAYLSSYSAVINHITSKGAYAVIDPHNYGCYNNAIITDTASFGTFWKNLATAFKSNENVVGYCCHATLPIFLTITSQIFDTNNEYNTMDESLVLSLNQAAINAIRTAGATTQTIFAEGNNWTGAGTWTTANDAMKGLTDPNNNLIYEMHLYLDSDSSGSHDTCASATIGVERAQGATAWLRTNGKKGIIGEFGGGSNTLCMQAVTGLLNHLKENSDVWEGAVWWAAGPWWGTSTEFSFEPPSGAAYVYYNSLLKQYVP